MAQCTLVLVAALLINMLSYCSAENVYCVTPTATSCSCPHSNHCATLSEYAQKTELYFTSNTTMVFLPGNHVLDTNITVTNVARLTMCGESSSGNRATVVCSGSVGLSFTSIVDFKIDFLTFASCSRKYNGTLSDFRLTVVYGAILLQSTQCAELVNCSFSDNDGTALVVINADVTLSGNNFTQNRAPTSLGGAIIAYNHTVLNFSGINNFVDNSATHGGAIYTSHNTVLGFNGTNNFINNSGGEGSAGGAIFITSTVLSCSGTNNFINNFAHYGGAIFTLYYNTVLNFSGTNNFINNSAVGSGGAIYTYDAISFNGTTNFINNSAYWSGGAIYAVAHTAVLSFNGISKFINNSAYYDGGAIYALYNTVLNFSGTNSFINNSAYWYGGAIFTWNNIELSFSGTNNFINNSVIGSGGAIYTYDTISFNGTNNFINNSAYWSGGAIYAVAHTAVLSFNGISNFINNSAYYDGGAIYALYNTILSFSGINNFLDSIAISGGAIYAESNTTLTFDGTIYFTNNGYNGGRIDILTTGSTKGGGVYLGFRSTFSILPNTTVYWENNHANLGGAIYVYDNNPIRYCPRYSRRVTSEFFVPEGECFFQLPGQNLSNGIDVQLVFKNNSADAAGSVLYGGAIDNCKLAGISYISGRVFNKLVHIEDDDTNSNISSLPLHICPCINSFPNCRSYFHYPRTVYPGEMFQVSVVAVGQRDGTVPSRAISTVEHTSFFDSQYWLQLANNTCTTFNYSVFSLSRDQSVNISLYPEGSPCSTSQDKLQIEVTLSQNCPPGFSISESARSCVCEPRLAQYTNSCTITNGVGQITRDSGQQFWVGYDNQSDGVILYPRCPFDYCVSQAVNFSLNNTDMQCAYNRSGLLCGDCNEGYSLVLGTSHCKKCTNSHLALLIPFAVMGVALVFLLLVSKLTVATGVLSGLVFYANIVGVNRTIFLPADSTVVFSMFIAWLNLDFGIETCFYDGMDAYSKTWLQFVFPIYIWVLVGLMILICNYSPRFANMLGNNPVSVLATLILLSYTKILHTLITVLYVTYLEYPTYNRTLRTVWLYDANIGYFAGEHIPLFLVAMLVFIFLFFPYTLLLLFGQWLQAISHLKLFSWVNRVKPFMDSYHAPYKAKHRYWPGLLLVLRFILLLVFAFNPQHDPSVNLLAIQVGVGILQMWAWMSGGVYRNWCLDALEGSFALNLIILAAATFFVNNSGGNQRGVGYTSVSIALATFFGILAFQLANMTGITQYLKRKCTTLKVAIRNLQKAEAEPSSPTGSLPDRLNNPEEYELSYHPPQEHATAETKVNEA